MSQFTVAMMNLNTILTFVRPSVLELKPKQDRHTWRHVV